MRGRTLKQHIKQKMKNHDFKKAWHELDAEFAIFEEIIKAREKSGLTQEELANKIGTKQPALSRLERGGFRKANIETLKKIAEALDHNLVVKFEPKKVHLTVY